MMQWVELVGVYAVGVMTPVFIAAGREIAVRIAEARKPRCPWCNSRTKPGQKRKLCDNCYQEAKADSAAPEGWPRA